MAEKEKIKLPLKRIFENNIFLMKMMCKTSKTYFVIDLSTSIIQALTYFVLHSLLLRYIINGIGEGIAFSKVAFFLILFLVFQVIYSLFESYFLEYLRGVLMNRIVKDIHISVYKKASSVELACYENPKFYDRYVKALYECQMRAEGTAATVKNLVNKLVTFSADFTLLFTIDPWLILFLIIPIITIPISAKANKLGFKKSNAVQEVSRRRDYSKRTFYLADYAKEMRLTKMPELLKKRFKEAGEDNIKLLKKYGFSLASLYYIITILNEVLTSAGVTVYSLWKTLAVGTMGYGDCVVVINSIDQLTLALTDSANTIIKFQENALFIENLRSFYDYETKLIGGDKLVEGSADLELKNVSYKYQGASDYTLKNVSMKIGKNEKIAIVGHNGAGKTTLIKLMLRLYDCEGEITYGGVNIKDFDLKSYRDSFSSVMQDYHTFALSVAENVLLRPYTEEDKENVIEALKKSDIYDKVTKFHDGINTVMTREFDEHGELLSGGEQQKLCIAHVYSKKNRFVILDEPSSALDPIAEYEMYKRMIDACKDCGMILISHRLSSAVLADRVYYMEKGKVLECGTHKELMAKNGIYAKMFKRQAENYAEVE